MSVLKNSERERSFLEGALFTLRDLMMIIVSDSSPLALMVVEAG